MPRLVVVCVCVAVALAAGCRPPPPRNQTTAVEEFTAPAPPGHEEKWEEPEPKKEEKPPEPPPPPEPTSPPPESALGYAFGLTKTKAISVCSQRGSWSKKGTGYTCSKPAEGAPFPGKPLVSFCDDKLCAVGVAIEVETGDWDSWKTRWEEMKKSLTDQHGPPTVDTLTVDPKCQNEGFSKCLDDGTASAEATWKWKQGHRVTLTMGKKKSGEGPSAIRFVSIVEPAK